MNASALFVCAWHARATSDSAASCSSIHSYGGGVTTVANWGLQMDIVAVPEVETRVAAATAGAFGAFWLNRQIYFGTKGRSV